MIRAYFKWLLFISSYTPLFLVFIIKYFTIPTRFEFSVTFILQEVLLKNIVFMLLILIISMSIIMLIFFKNSIETLADTSINFEYIENKNTEILAYLATYLVPFVGVNFNGLQDIISNLILFLVIGFIYIKSDLIVINPLLSFFGYNIYSCKIRDSKNIIFITKKSYIKPEKYFVKKISNNIYYYK